MNIIKYILPLIYKNKFTELTYFVTNKCNFHCKHCFVIDKLNKPCNELTVEEIKKMGNHISSLQRVHLGGGEPFLRKDIDEIAITVSNNWNTAVICIPTNGWETNNIQNTVLNFGKNSKKILRLHFSLNALNSEMDEFCNKNGAFLQLTKSIAETKKISDQYSNISLIALSTFNDYNQDNFKELLSYAKNVFKFDDISIQLARAHDLYKPNLKVNEFENLLEKEFVCSENHFGALNSYRKLVRKATASYEQNPRMIIRCNSGKTRAVMSPNGDIYPCEHLGYPNGQNSEEWLMGNIREFNYDIHKLLRCPKSKEIRNRILKNQCHCSHGIDLALNLLASNKFKAKVLYHFFISTLMKGSKKVKQ